MEAFDIYLAYASEDAAFVTDLRLELEQFGLKVWQDTVEMMVGPTLRGQMDAGLRQSSFGAVVVSASFFRKKWPVEEMDGLFALEAPGETRILPIWLGVTVDDVASHSPMLAARSAAVVGENLADVARSLHRSVLLLRGNKSFGATLRAEIQTGLNWLGPVEFFHESLSLIDHDLERFTPVVLSRSDSVTPIDLPLDDGTPPLSLAELHSTSPLHAGRYVTTIAHQMPGSLQVLRERTERDHSQSVREPRLVSYVFQLKSVDSQVDDLTYVQVLWSYEPGVPLPPAPKNWLTWVVGVPIARGTTDASRHRQTTYFLAAWMMYTPKVEAEPAS